MALLCTGVLLSGGEGKFEAQSALTAVLLVYDLWAGLLLWFAARGRAFGWTWLHPWIDITWTGLLLQLTGNDAGLIILTAVQPVVLASIGQGVRRGVLLALYLALWVLLHADAQHWLVLSVDTGQVLKAVGVLALVPVAALLSRPASVLRERINLVHGLEDRLDPRRGLQATATKLVDGLRTEIDAHLVGVVLPAIANGPAILCTAKDGAFAAKPEVHAQLEAMLRQLPAEALTHHKLRLFGWVGGTRLFGSDSAVRDARLRLLLDELCELLELRELLVVPFYRYQQRHGHLLLGGVSGTVGRQSVEAVVASAPEFFRILEQAAMVDQLVRETAAHERVRIGRDLHDSAIQPYLGFKYAVEALARRVPLDNAARPGIDALAQMVDAEIVSLREIVSGLRNGEATGDNALLPAVRRQVRHFSDLFGIQVQLECPQQLLTSRYLAGAVFHMVNEALNNVRKHSMARSAQVSLGAVDGWLQLRVGDDGGTVRGRQAPDFSPRSLAERVRELGGSLRVHRPDGTHTEIVISVPLDAAARA